MGTSFKQAIKKRNNLLVVDGFNFAFRYKHANKRDFAQEYVKAMLSFAQSYSASQIIVLSDAGSDYRYDIYPEYKQSRKDLRADQTEEEKAAFELFMEDWKAAFQLCKSIGETIQFSGVEADDIAAYLATNNKIRDKYEHIWVISTDKDWDLLIDDKVSRFSYRTRKEVTIDNWDSHYPYGVDDHLSVKVIQGDKSDNIPGVAGIGEKRAATLVRQYGTAYDIHDSLPINDSKVYIKNLNNFGSQILRNYELMDLVTFCEAAIGEHVIKLDSIIENIT